MHTAPLRRRGAARKSRFTNILALLTLGGRRDPAPSANEMIPEPTHRKTSLIGGLRASFLTGLVVISPIFLTLYLIWLVTGWIDGWVLPVVPEAWRPDTYFGLNVHGVGVIFFFVFTTLVGWVAKGLIGRQLIRTAERLVDRTPVVRTVYGGLKQIAETVLAQSDTKFDRACLVEYPRPGIWAIAFVSTRAKGEIATRVPRDGEILSIFLPTTPNPTSGFLLFVEARDVVMLDMKVEDAAKLIISAGLVYPNPKDPTQPPAALASSK
jgi:uncharacterized membrane protein